MVFAAFAAFAAAASHFSSLPPSAMPHTVSNLNDPLIKKVVLHVFNQHRFVPGTTKVAKRKYTDSESTLKQQYGLLVSHKLLKRANKEVGSQHCCLHSLFFARVAHMLAVAVACLVVLLLQQRLDDECNTTEWKALDASYSVEVVQSEVWAAFPQSMPNNMGGGSNPSGDIASFSLTPSSSTATLLSPPRAFLPPSARVDSQIMRNIHSELMSISQSLRLISAVCSGGSRLKVKKAIENLQNSEPNDSESGQMQQ